MKYGKLQFAPPQTFKEDKAALKDLLEKGEIDDQLYREKMRDLNRDFLLFIARTNSMNPGKGRKGASIGSWKADFAKAKTMEIAQSTTANMAAEQLAEQEVEDHIAAIKNVLPTNEKLETNE